MVTKLLLLEVLLRTMNWHAGHLASRFSSAYNYLCEISFSSVQEGQWKRQSPRPLPSLFLDSRSWPLLASGEKLLEMRFPSSLVCHLLAVWAPYRWQSVQDFLSAFIFPGNANVGSGT